MAQMAESDRIMMTCPSCKEEIVDPRTTNPPIFEYFCGFFCIIWSIPFCYAPNAIDLSPISMISQRSPTVIQYLINYFSTLKFRVLYMNKIEYII